MTAAAIAKSIVLLLVSLVALFGGIHAWRPPRRGKLPLRPEGASDDPS
jgi:hypothetical protein